MVNIWQRSSNVELVYVGKGDLQEALKQRAMKMGVSGKVKFLGWRDDIPEIMPVFDLFALPSLNEGMGRVLVEAMASGKPVVGSNVGGIPDLIKSGENGFLVEPRDVNGLAAAIEKLLLDKNMRQAMGKKGQTIAPNFSEAKMIEKIDALYASLLHRKHNRNYHARSTR
jgi:glycosyltransferase involved in cell wall biosynthesis